MRLPFLPHDTTSFTVTELARTQIEVFKKCCDFLSRRRFPGLCVVSHTTALQVMGVNLPRLRKFNVDKIRLTVTSKNLTHTCNDGVYHVFAHNFSPVVIGDRLNCVPPVVAWAQLSWWLSLDELVVLGDSLMCRNKYLKRASLHDFHEFVTEAKNFPGRKKCLRALPLMSENTDSPQESRLKLVLYHAGLPQPTANFHIVHYELLHGLHVDLAYEAKLIAIEYDGQYHETDAQKAADAERRAALESIGWTVHVVKADVLSPGPAQTLLLSQLVSELSS